MKTIYRHWDGRSFEYRTTLGTAPRGVYLEQPYRRRKYIVYGDANRQKRFNESININYDRYIGQNAMNGLTNKALEKVHGKLQNISNQFEALYERQQALDMITGAARGLLFFLKNYKKPSYWKGLAKGAKKPETLPQAWLMWNFGLKPLIGTIDSCLNLLAQDFPTHMERGASRTKVPHGVLSSDAYQRFVLYGDFEVIAEIRAYVQPNMNPNKALANVLGLGTPFSTIFSVVPWGWAVDYFVNASQLMNNFESVHPGVRIKSAYITLFYRGQSKNHGTIVGVKPNISWSNSEEFYAIDRSIFDMKYKPYYSYPLMGSNQAANLLSAIALTLNGAKK